MFRFVIIALALAGRLSGQELQQGWYRGRLVTYHIVDGRPLYQGDIELDIADATDATAARDAMAIPGNRFRWTNATIPYTIESDVPNPQRILDAIQHWNGKTPIKITPRVTEANYIRFFRTPNTGVCSSPVGMVGGGQRINLDDGCGFGQIVHEIGHSVGLWHEQSRTDRDFYVRLLAPNIDKRYLADFGQELTDGMDIGFYDYGSIMHYDSYSFSRNGQASLQTIPPGIPIGQRTGLSDGDVDAVRRLYQADAATTTVTTFPSGLPIVIDGTLLAPPQTFQWDAGSTHSLSVPAANASGATRYIFGRWSDDGGATHAVTISPSYRVYTANFVRQFRLVTGANGDGGQVTVSPSSPDGYYPDGTLVTVTATPAAGFSFAGWTGANIATANLGRTVASFVMRAGDTRYLANFTSAPTVTVTSNPPGRTVQVDGQTGTTPLIFVWDQGSTHTLNVATVTQAGLPNPVQYQFKGWADGGDALRSVTFDGKSAVYTADFETQYSIVSAAKPLGFGSIGVAPAAPSGFYPAGTQLQFTASPAGTVRFLGWTDDVTGSNNPEMRLVDDQLLVTANFAIPRNLILSNVLSAATYVPGAVAPGQIVTIFGLEIGPQQEALARLTAAGRVDTNIGNTRVLFDGVAAPMLYAGTSQVTAIVPFAVANSSSTRLQVEANGSTSNALTLAVAQSAPGLFTRDASGVGPGAIRNQDSSLNGPENPAVKGSVVVLYGTGAGVMNPPLADGVLATDAGGTQLPVKAFIASRECVVEYAGPVPTLVAGALQVNVRLPADLPSGNLPVSIQVGDVRSPAVVTVSVQ